MIGLGLFVTVSTIVTYASIDGWQAFAITRARASLVTDLDEATIRIESFVRRATTLPDQATVDGQHYRVDEQTLILTVPAVASDGTAIAGVVDTVVYTIRAEGLVELVEPGGGTRTTSDRLVVPAPATAAFTVTAATKPLVTSILGATRSTTQSPLARSVSLVTLARNAE